MACSRRSFVAIALGVVVLTSCSSGGDGARSGVDVQSINTNVGLGIELEAAAPANTVVRPQQAVPGEPSSTIPPFEFDFPRPSNRPCPAAGPFDFPELDTGVEPQGRPKAGNYPWKLDGKISGANEFVVDTFETRSITNVQDHGSIPGAFTYEQKQENLFDERQSRGGTLTTRFRVVPDPAVQNQQVPNDAGKGLFIESIVFEEKDREGKTVRTEFNPVPAVQLIAFPVKDGTAINSSGTDPATFARLSVTGLVKGKKQVDACGDRVDSWFVDAEFDYQFPTGNGQTETLISNYDYGVAPQYGGQLVFEHIEAPKEEPVVRIDARVGVVPTRSGG